MNHPINDINEEIKNTKNRVNYIEEITHEYLHKIHELKHEIDYLDSRVHKLTERKRLLDEQIKMEKEQVSYLIVTSKNFDEGKRKIKNWIKNKVKELTIVDPFFFSFDESKPPKNIRNLDEYVNGVCDYIPNSLEKISVYSNGTPPIKVVDKFIEVLSKKSIELIRFESNEIHDRFIIKNKKSAKIMGTSFTGLGLKLSIFVDLPDDDLQDLLEFLEPIQKA